MKLLALFFGVLILVSSGQLLACTGQQIVNINNEMNCKFGDPFRANIQKTSYGLIATVPGAKSSLFLPQRKHIQEVMSKFGSKSGDGWLLNASCAKDFAFTPVKKMRICNGEEVSKTKAIMKEIKWTQENAGWMIEILPVLKERKLTAEIKLYRNLIEVYDPKILNEIRWQTATHQSGTGNSIQLSTDLEVVGIQAWYRDLADHYAEARIDTTPPEKDIDAQLSLVAYGKPISPAIEVNVFDKTGRDITDLIIASGKDFNWKIIGKPGNWKCTPIKRTNLCKLSGSLPPEITVSVGNVDRTYIQDQKFSFLESAQVKSEVVFKDASYLVKHSLVFGAESTPLNISGTFSTCFNSDCKEIKRGSSPIYKANPLLPDSLTVVFLPNGSPVESGIGPSPVLLPDVSGGKMGDITIETKTVFDANGEQLCRVKLSYKEKEVNEESAKQDPDIAKLLSNVKFIKEKGSEIDCKFPDCKIPSGKNDEIVKVSTGLNDDWVMSKCSFPKPNWETTQVKMKVGASEDGVFCRAIVLVELGDEGAFQVNDKLPTWLGTSSWETEDEVMCDGLYCETPDFSLNAKVTANIKGRSISSECSPEYVPEKEEAESSSRFKLDPTKGGKALGPFKQPYFIPPPDMSMRIMPGMNQKFSEWLNLYKFE